MELLLRWGIYVVALIVSSYATRLLGLEFRVDYSNGSAIVKLFLAAAVLGLLNVTLGLLLKIITFPLILITLGLFAIVVNAVVLLLASQLVPSSIYVSGFAAAFVGSFFIYIVDVILMNLFGMR
jgi:putative membrane protein